VEAKNKYLILCFLVCLGSIICGCECDHIERKC